MRFSSFVPWNNLKILATQLDDRSIKSCFVGTCPCLVNSVAIIYIYNYIYIYNFSALLCNCFFLTWLRGSRLHKVFESQGRLVSQSRKKDWFPSQEKRLASKQKKMWPRYCDTFRTYHFLYMYKNVADFIFLRLQTLTDTKRLFSCLSKNIDISNRQCLELDTLTAALLHRWCIFSLNKIPCLHDGCGWALLCKRTKISCDTVRSGNWVLHFLRVSHN